MDEPGASRPGRFRRCGPPLLIVGALWLLGFPALRSYGVTWDEAVGDFFFGERYWSFFTSLDARYLDFAHDPFPAGHVPDLFGSPLREEPLSFYAVGGTLGAATSALLYGKLGWLDPFDGYHAANLLLAALLVVVFHRFLAGRVGSLVAVLAPLLLFTCPRIVCDLMANIKDFPEMVLFSTALVGFVAAYEAGSTARVLAAGALWGLALGAKTNAIFLAPILGGFFLLAPLSRPWSRRWQPLAALAGAGLIALAVLVSIWPYTYDDPPRRLWEHLVFLVVSLKELVRPGSEAPALQQVLFTTPIPFLLLFAAGLPATLRGALRRRPAELLLALWAGVVLARLSLPNAVNFDGVRHFLELFPAMAAIAAIGAASLVARARRVPARALRVVLAGGIVIVPLFSMAWSVTRAHPFEIAYWNGLIGGLDGAQARRMAQAGDYWGASYRVGIRWLDEHAAKDSLLVVPVIEHAVRLVAPLRLRPDIRLLPVSTPFEPAIPPEKLALVRDAARDHVVYVMFVPRLDFMNEIMIDCLKRLEPVQLWTLDDAPVLLIYRYVAPP